MNFQNTTQSSYAIQTIALTKKYPVVKRYRELILHPFERKIITILKDVNIQIRRGELFGLLGPNGAGKTTLLKILCTLVLPTRGKAFVSGYNVTENEERIKEIIGYVLSEERSFFWRMTGRQNLKFFATLNNMFGRQADIRIEELADLVELKDVIDKIFKNYSSGMKQKLAIARGMLTDPHILILDEPTRTLDPISTYSFRKFIKDVIVHKEKKTVIIATNNMQEAEELCDRAAILDKGTVKICGSLSNIKSMIGHKGQYIFQIRGTYEQVKRKLNCRTIDGTSVSLVPDCSHNTQVTLSVKMKNGKNGLSDIIKFIMMSGMDIEAFYPEEYTLNEVFTKIVS